MIRGQQNLRNTRANAIQFMGVHRCEHPATSALSTVRPPSPANYPDGTSALGSPAWLLQLNSWLHAERYPTPVKECQVRTWSSSSFFPAGLVAVALVRTERGDQIGFLAARKNLKEIYLRKYLTRFVVFLKRSLSTLKKALSLAK